MRVTYFTSRSIGTHTFFILQGLKVSTDSVFQAFMMVQCLCDCCGSVEFPLLKRNLNKIGKYLSKFTPI